MSDKANTLGALAAALVLGLFLSQPAGAQVPPPVDTDLDGVTDDVDECDTSDLSATVIIDTCDSGVPNTLFSTGCTISDLISECEVGARNHGKYVSCVSRVTNGLKKSKVITGKQKGAIQSCAAQSDNGK